MKLFAAAWIKEQNAVLVKGCKTFSLLVVLYSIFPLPTTTIGLFKNLSLSVFSAVGLVITCNANAVAIAGILFLDMWAYVAADSLKFYFNVNTRKHNFSVRVIGPRNNLNCATVDFSSPRVDDSNVFLDELTCRSI